MNKIRHIVISLLTFSCIVISGQPTIDVHRLLLGETLQYKAKWEFLTIGTATTKSERKLYKIGQSVCCKIQLEGTTNGLARLFYLNDRWMSYIDIHNLTTQKAFRRIREGRYKLDELTYFYTEQKKAEIWCLDYQTEKFQYRKTYKTPVNIRDVVAGFMMIRLVDLSKYNPGARFVIDGFYEDTGYKIDVTVCGMEYVKTDKGKALCYKLKPSVPKNKVFQDVNSVDVWINVNKPYQIVSIQARLILGNLCIEQI
ncbi:MAG: DUF3108 domain-containing protein [Paludibacter sp.]